MPPLSRPAALMAAAAALVAAARPATASAAAPARGDVFLTYGSGPFARQTQRLAGEARATGAFGKVVAADPSMVDPAYASRHAAILDAPRGGGYWLWKPYLVAKLLDEARDGDVVMYVDAGSQLVGDPRPLLDLARKHGFLGFRMGHQSKAWTKGDVYKALNLDLATYGPERQLSGAVLLFKKCPRTVDLVQRWLALCERPELVTDAPSVAPNDPAFQDHRHDQSILTLLLLKHGVPLVLEDQTHPREVAKAVYVARLKDGMEV